MAIHLARVFDASGGVAKDFDMWSLYAAFTRPSPDCALVKIGISTRPMQRLHTISINSPFPVDAALWVSAGGSSSVRKLEHAVHVAFASRRTRGEWFRFDLSCETDKREFHGTIRELYFKHTGRSLVWKKTGPEQIRSFAAQRSSPLYGRK